MDLLHQLFHAIRYEHDEQKAIQVLEQDPAIAQAKWHGSEKYVSGSTALLYAAQWGCMEVTRLLAEYGADVNANSTHGGGSPLAWAAEAGEPAAVRFLLAAGADANADLGGGRTALHAAAAGGISEGRKDPQAYGLLAELLIKAGADVNADSPDGPPLAVALEHGNEAVAEALRRHGAG